MNRKLLVVDDDKAIRDVLQASFNCLGYKVLTAEDGQKGEIAARENLPGLMILDVMMPGKNGFTVCRELKRDSATAKIPIILLTAKNLKEDVYWGYDCGADAYVTKPYEPKVLEALVEQLITEAEEGHPRNAWTGLPHANNILKEGKARLEAGGEVLLAELSFPDEHTKIFVQKYGQAKYRDLIHATSWKVYEVLREEAPAGTVGQRSDDALVVLIHPLEAEKVQKMVQLITAEIIDPHYDEKDLAAGAIIFRERGSTDGGEGILQKVPLLRLQWKKLDPDRESS